MARKPRAVARVAAATRTRSSPSFCWTMASWIKEAVQEMAKAAVPFKKNDCDSFLRRPSDEGAEAFTCDERHSPRPHEQPSDFRGWFKLSLGSGSEGSSESAQRRNSEVSSSASFLIHGALEKSSKGAVNETTAVSIIRSRRSSCPVLSCDKSKQ